MATTQNNTGAREKVIPIMPCPDIRVQVAFYRELGFEVLGVYTSPNPYAALQRGNIELHFYGSRKAAPHENPTMCFLMVQDVDEVNRVFTAALKQHYGKIPRTGFPKITKVRNLVGDRRFTLTDPGGNTLFIGEKSTEADRFFRTLKAPAHAKAFAVLYDVVYSKEDPLLAESMLPKYTAMGESLTGLDKAKYLLLLADLQKYLGRKVEDAALRQLLQQYGEDTPDWRQVRSKHLAILEEDE
ncbi:VOC family protein [Chitinophaga alhagiae]|uniref:VOC family protein n=1 Tax=Chitinophaga alhagiae TaxID=2203219 RepID=UPI000E5C53EE|nr:VOC family protein [Chitinophaga alhagiae]